MQSGCPARSAGAQGQGRRIPLERSACPTDATGRKRCRGCKTLETFHKSYENYWSSIQSQEKVQSASCVYINCIYIFFTLALRAGFRATLRATSRSTPVVYLKPVGNWPQRLLQRRDIEGLLGPFERFESGLFWLVKRPAPVDAATAMQLSRSRISMD